MSPAAKVLCDHNYAKKLPANYSKEPQDQEDLTEEEQDEEPDRSELQQNLKDKR